MKKELIVWEIKKLWSLPMIPIFLVLCLAFNILLIIDDRYGNDYVHYVGNITETIGGTMNTKFDKSLAALPESSYQKKLISETAGAIDIFEGYDATEIGNLHMERYQINGIAADLLEQKYTKLQSSVDTLAEQDASLSLSAAGMTKNLMDSLFFVLCRALITEGILLAVLMSLYSCGNERMNGTSLMVYSTRVGRHIQRNKMIASGFSALISYLVLAGVSVFIFTLVWDMHLIWNASMSSQFNYLVSMGIALPFITWTPFTIIGYLIATLGMGAILILLFHGFGFAIGLLTGKTYKGFILFLLIVAINFELMMLAGDHGQWFLYQLSQWTPIALWWFQPLWFTDMSVGAILPWQEGFVALFCCLLSALLLALSIWHFQKKDVIS